MPSRHLDIGCGAIPRNPYRCDEAHGVDIPLPAGADPRLFKCANLSLEPIPYPDSHFDSVSAFDFLDRVPRMLTTPHGRNTRFPFVELMDEVHPVLKPAGSFEKLRNERGLYPEALQSDAQPSLARRFKRWRRTLVSGLSHLVWELECVKPAA